MMRRRLHLNARDKRQSKRMSVQKTPIGFDHPVTNKYRLFDKRFPFIERVENFLHETRKPLRMAKRPVNSVV